MKKKDNTLLWTTGIGAAAGLFINILEQYNETKDRNEDFDLGKVDWGRVGQSALMGAGMGLAAGAMVRLVDSDEDIFYPSYFLNTVLKQHSLKQNPEVLLIAIQKRNEIKNFLSYFFSYELAGNPINWGSYSHGTANSSNFDLDVIVPFRRTIGSLEEMHLKVYNALKMHFHDSDVKLVRKQRKSIGVKYIINGEELFIDIVPGREINNYAVDNELKLYVASDDAGGQSTSIKTNTKIHKEEITGLTDERKVTRLLKIWRDSHRLNFKSIAIKKMVITAFEETNHVPYDIYGKLEMALKYIKGNILTIRIVDGANSSNIISDSMSISEKKLIAEKASYDLQMLAKDSNHLKNIFSI